MWKAGNIRGFSSLRVELRTGRWRCMLPFGLSWLLPLHPHLAVSSGRLAEIPAGDEQIIPLHRICLKSLTQQYALIRARCGDGCAINYHQPDHFVPRRGALLASAQPNAPSTGLPSS
jgi:hypothetical protein